MITVTSVVKNPISSSVFSVCSVGDLAGDGARGQAETCNGPEGNGTSDKEGATGDAARGRPSARGQIQQSIADESPSRVAGFGLTPSESFLNERLADRESRKGYLLRYRTWKKFSG